MGDALPRPAYSEFARHYDALFGEPDLACVEFVEHAVPPPATLLDAGCGTGRYASILAIRGYNVVAVDREPQMLRHGLHGRRTVDFVLADLTLLPFTAAFDAVLARGVLNDLVRLRDLTQALRALAGTLARHGLFIADVRERRAHHLRIARQPLIERTSGGVAFRARRRMHGVRFISIEQFALAGVWSKPFRFQMRTFTEDEVQSLWRLAGLEVLAILPSYGPASRLQDRLVVLARRLV